jgi:hypothetical protein
VTRHRSTLFIRFDLLQASARNACHFVFELHRQRYYLYVSELERFQDLQVKLVVAGFDTTLKARRERDEAVFSLTVALHQEQTPEVMAKLTEIIGGHGFAFTAENETVEITALGA